MNVKVWIYGHIRNINASPNTYIYDICKQLNLRVLSLAYNGRLLNLSDTLQDIGYVPNDIIYTSFKDSPHLSQTEKYYMYRQDQLKMHQKIVADQEQTAQRRQRSRERLASKDQDIRAIINGFDNYSLSPEELALKARVKSRIFGDGGGYCGCSIFVDGLPFYGRDDARRPNPQLIWLLSHVREAIEPAVRLGADINSRDKNGNTPLHLVDSRPYPPPSIEASKVVEALIKQGADVFAKNDQGVMPQHPLAEKHREKLQTLMALHKARISNLAQGKKQQGSETLSTYDLKHVGAGGSIMKQRMQKGQPLPKISFTDQVGRYDWSGRLKRTAIYE